jgi:hypothetical protein
MVQHRMHCVSNSKRKHRIENIMGKPELCCERFSSFRRGGTSQSASSFLAIAQDLASLRLYQRYMAGEEAFHSAFLT